MSAKRRKGFFRSIIPTFSRSSRSSSAPNLPLNHVTTATTTTTPVNTTTTTTPPSPPPPPTTTTTTTATATTNTIANANRTTFGNNHPSGLNNGTTTQTSSSLSTSSTTTTTLTTPTATTGGTHQNSSSSSRRPSLLFESSVSSSSSLVPPLPFMSSSRARRRTFPSLTPRSEASVLFPPHPGGAQKQQQQQLPLDQLTFDSSHDVNYPNTSSRYSLTSNTNYPWLSDNEKGHHPTLNADLMAIYKIPVPELVDLVFIVNNSSAFPAHAAIINARCPMLLDPAQTELKWKLSIGGRHSRKRSVDSHRSSTSSARAGSPRDKTLVAPVSSAYSPATIDSLSSHPNMKKLSYSHFCDPLVFGLLLEYLYSDKVALDAHSAIPMLCIANLMDLPRLAAIAQSFIGSSLSVENVCGLWNSAVAHGAHGLADDCAILVKAAFSEVATTAGFLSLRKDALLTILPSDNLIANSESEVFEAVVAWGRAVVSGISSSATGPTSTPGGSSSLASSPSSLGSGGGSSSANAPIKDLLSDLMSFVRFPLMSSEYLMDSVEPMGIVRDTLLKEAYQYKLAPDRFKAKAPDPNDPSSPTSVPSSGISRRIRPRTPMSQSVRALGSVVPHSHPPQAEADGIPSAEPDATSRLGLLDPVALEAIPGGLPLALEPLIGSYTNSDVRLKFGSRSFYAHKVILAARSPAYFRPLFTSGMRETTAKEVNLTDAPVNGDVFAIVLRHMYTDELETLFEPENCVELLSASVFFGLELLQAAAEAFISERLDLDNVVTLWVSAYHSNATGLLEHTTAFIKEHFRQVGQDPLFGTSVDAPLLATVLRDSDLKVENEIEVWNIVLDWAIARSAPGSQQTAVEAAAAAATRSPILGGKSRKSVRSPDPPSRPQSPSPSSLKSDFDKGESGDSDSGDDLDDTQPPRSSLSTAVKLRGANIAHVRDTLEPVHEFIRFGTMPVDYLLDIIEPSGLVPSYYIMNAMRALLRPNLACGVSPAATPRVLEASRLEDERRAAELAAQEAEELAQARERERAELRAELVSVKLELSSIDQFRMLICRRCNRKYQEANNNRRACTRHPEEFQEFRWLEEERRSERVDAWPCCGRIGMDAPGCTQAPHVSDPSARPHRRFDTDAKPRSALPVYYPSEEHDDTTNQATTTTTTSTLATTTSSLAPGQPVNPSTTPTVTAPAPASATSGSAATTTTATASSTTVTSNHETNDAVTDDNTTIGSDDGPLDQGSVSPLIGSQSDPAAR